MRRLVDTEHLAGTVADTEQGRHIAAVEAVPRKRAVKLERAVPRIARIVSIEAAGTVDNLRGGASAGWLKAHHAGAGEPRRRDAGVCQIRATGKWAALWTANHDQAGDGLLTS